MSPPTSPMSSPDAIQASDTAHVQVVRIDFGKEVLWLVAVFCVCLVLFSVALGFFISQDRTHEKAYDKLERQYRMTELKLDDWTVVAHRAGLTFTGDYTRGPQGNLDTESFNLKEK